MSYRYILFPVKVLGDVERRHQGLHPGIEFLVEVFTYICKRILIHRNEGYGLLLQRLEHIFVAFVIAPDQRFKLLRHIAVKRLKRGKPLLRPWLQHLHHFRVDGLRKHGAVALVFVSHLHYALLGLRPEEDVAFLSHHIGQRFAQRMLGQHCRNFPNQRREDVVAPVSHGKRPFAVDFGHDLLDVLPAGSVAGQNFIPQHSQQHNGYILHSRFKEIQQVICGLGPFAGVAVLLELGVRMGQGVRKHYFFL